MGELPRLDTVSAAIASYADDIITYDDLLRIIAEHQDKLAKATGVPVRSVYLNVDPYTGEVLK